MPDKKEEINTKISAIRARCAEPGKEYREHRDFGVLKRCLRYDTRTETLAVLVVGSSDTGRH